jgi:ketosteroid isomerase-like protein
MMKFSLSFAIGLGLATAAVAAAPADTPLAAAEAAPAAAEAALAAAEAALAALSQHDAATMDALLMPDALLLAQNYAPDRSLETRIVTRAQLLANIANPGQRLHETMFDAKVQVEGDIAHVWGPYTFDIDGKRHHCGIDSFAMARVDGRWRIASLTWTSDLAACAKWGK